MKPIVLKIKSLSVSERKITAEIIDCIREIDLLKIHLEMGYSSLMEFLIRECGYSETAALRRIDAARIVNVIPEIRADLKNGSLNLSQVSIVAQSVRQKEKLGEKVSLDKKIEIVNAVKHKRTFEAQKIAAQMLNLPVLKMEKVKFQADDSVRIEISLTKPEMEILQKAKELLGHIRPGMNMKELVVMMAERIIKAMDPAREVRVRGKAGSLYVGAIPILKNQKLKNQPSINQESKNRTSINLNFENPGSASEFNFEISRGGERRFASVNPKTMAQTSTVPKSTIPKRVTAAVKRQVFRRDQGCQWKDPVSGEGCGSRHLLEMDHKISKWAGGGHELENLELKCRAHNQWKYKREAGMRAKPSPTRT